MALIVDLEFSLNILSLPFLLLRKKMKKPSTTRDACGMTNEWQKHILKKTSMYVVTKLTTFHCHRENYFRADVCDMEFVRICQGEGYGYNWRMNRKMNGRVTSQGTRKSNKKGKTRQSLTLCCYKGFKQTKPLLITLLWMASTTPNGNKEVTRKVTALLNKKNQERIWYKAWNFVWISYIIRAI